MTNDLLQRYPFVIGMLHNLKLNRFHPITFHSSPPPGGRDMGARYHSSTHSTEGFADRKEALAECQKIQERFPFVDQVGLCLEKDFAWDGEHVPVMTVMLHKIRRQTSHVIIDTAAEGLEHALAACLGVMEQATWN